MGCRWIEGGRGVFVVVRGSIVLVILLAGCAQTIDADEPVLAPTPWLAQWTSPELYGPEPDLQNSPPPMLERPERPACGDRNCHRQDVQVVPGNGDLVFSIEWEGQDESYDTEAFPGSYLGGAALALDMVILRDGQVVADGIEAFHYASVAVIPDAAPGDYVVEVVARWGTGHYLGAVRWQDPADQGHNLGLPDLVMLPPDHVNFNVPLGQEAEAALRMISPGCGPDETVEDQERRCLRFAGVLGNQGPGDLEMRLDYEQAFSTLTGAGHWQQVIHTSDGETLHPIGAAEYHAVHGHFHILDFVATTLYEYDLENGRGDPTGHGRKTGFCVVDGGLVDPVGLATEPQYHGDGCCYLAGMCQMDMIRHPHFSMGMSAGWYDIYPWWRADQYVEVSGLPDGLYELVSVINPNGLLVETDLLNNEASTVIRIHGDRVEMVEQRSQANVGPHPDADWGYRPG